MSFAIDAVGTELHGIAEAFLDKHQALAAARASLDASADALPEFWPDMSELGWPGIHISETFGGQGGSLLDLAVVLAERGVTGGASAPVVRRIVDHDAVAPKLEVAAFQSAV